MSETRLARFPAGVARRPGLKCIATLPPDVTLPRLKAVRFGDEPAVLVVSPDAPARVVTEAGVVMELLAGGRRR